MNGHPGFVHHSDISDDIFKSAAEESVKYVIDKEFELIITDAHVDWIDTKVGFLLNNKNNVTEVHFYHKGWPQNNEHYRISCYCWAMYLRILKRYLEYGEQVPYENRLNA